MKTGDFEGTSVSKILNFIQGVELLHEWAKGLHKSLLTVKVQRSLQHPPFCNCSVLFYSALFYVCSQNSSQYTDWVTCWIIHRLPARARYFSLLFTKPLAKWLLRVLFLGGKVASVLSWTITSMQWGVFLHSPCMTSWHGQQLYFSV
jgi:hypothetical protein